MQELVVVKFGTSVVTDQTGALNEDALAMLVAQIAVLHRQHRLAVVSSGAVAAGQVDIEGFANKAAERKAAAAIGNPKLMAKYAEHFAKAGVKVAQILCDRETFSDRKKYLELQETLATLWRHDILPIINENDVISDFELRFSDNDELATLFAMGFNARQLLLGTSVDGLLDKGELVPRVDVFDKKIFSLVERHKSDFGLGGMLSKLSCAERATRLGVEVVIFNAAQAGNVIAALERRTGTVCPANKTRLSSYHKWVAGIGLVLARIHIDEGAVEALRQRKSLLAVGVTTVDGNFEAGEIVEIRSQDSDEMVAVGRTNIGSRDLGSDKERRGVMVAHANEVVVW